MERGRLIRLVVLFVLIVAIIITAVSLLGRTRYATLFHGMSPEDAGEVYALLREQGVDARAQGTTAIEVPAELVDSLIIELAAQGYPKSGLSYELYTNMQAFGTTEVEKEAYRVAQREENLRKTLMRLDKVVDAIVLLTPANQPAFVIDDTAFHLICAISPTVSPSAMWQHSCKSLSVRLGCVFRIACFTVSSLWITSLTRSISAVLAVFSVFSSNSRVC